ncbi:hypothetical protein HN51_036482, partial [Arachis hypogaea]
MRQLPRQQDTDSEAKAILNKRKKPFLFYYANEQENGKVGSRTRWSKERGVLLPGWSRMTRESH